MITLTDYFGPWYGTEHVTDEHEDNAQDLLERVNVLLDEAFEDGVDLHVNPATKTYISGKTLGGFRPLNATQGAPNSSHKEARAVDVYDPNDELDEWCYKHQDRLMAHNLYMEHPSATKKWCHLTTRAPKSGKRCFLP